MAAICKSPARFDSVVIREKKLTYRAKRGQNKPLATSTKFPASEEIYNQRACAMLRLKRGIVNSRSSVSWFNVNGVWVL